MSDKILLGKVTQRETPFGTVETKISLGPKDFEKIGINCQEWKNFVVKTSKAGTLYMELDNWKPKGAAVAEGAEDLPF